MGIAYRCDAATGLSVSVWAGDVDSDERERHIATLALDADWGAGGLLLTDLTRVSASSRPDAQQVLDAAHAFLQHLAGLARGAKWALVATETFDEARRFRAYIEEEVWHVIVFDDLDAATDWLGADARRVGALIDELCDEISSADPSSRPPQH